MRRQAFWLARGLRIPAAAISPVLGGKAQFSAYLHERIQLVTTASLPYVDKQIFPFGDFRVRLWGSDAGSWYPALSLDLGYAVRIGDWFMPGQPDGVIHTPLFGSRFTFPLDRMKGRIFADWAGGYGGSWFFIFYCGAEWRLAGPVGVRIEGDIFTRVGGFKYTGWSVGPYLEW